MEKLELHIKFSDSKTSAPFLNITVDSLHDVQPDQYIFPWRSAQMEGEKKKKHISLSNLSWKAKLKEKPKLG